MPHAFQIHKQEAAYFLTLHVVNWIDVFSRKNYRDLITDSLNFCVDKKGLDIFAYVIMSNHIHLMIRASQNNLSNVVRDFKRYTSFAIAKAMLSEPESRKEWILKLFSDAASKHKRNENYQVWTHENHAVEIFSPAFIFQRVNYIHQNPVRAGIVQKAEDYLYSSAGDY